LKGIGHQEAEREEPKECCDSSAKEAKSNPAQGVIHYSRGDFQREA